MEKKKIQFIGSKKYKIKNSNPTFFYFSDGTIIKKYNNEPLKLPKKIKDYQIANEIYDENKFIGYKDIIINDYAYAILRNDEIIRYDIAKSKGIKDNQIKKLTPDYTKAKQIIKNNYN